MVLDRDQSRSGAGAEIQWSARGGKAYVLLGATDLRGEFTPIATNQASGGKAPWFTTTGTTTTPAHSPRQSYAVEVQP